MDDRRFPPGIHILGQKPGPGSVHQLAQSKKFQPGDAVYFKRIKETSLPHGRYQEFKGCHGFGILLGTVPENQPDPPQIYLNAVMSQLGWVTFDDVKQALGDETLQKVLAFVMEKYFEKPKEPPETPAPA